MFKIDEIKVGGKFRYKDPVYENQERVATCTKITYYDYYKIKDSKHTDLPKLGGDLYIIEGIDDRDRKVFLSVDCRVDYNMQTFFDEEEKENGKENR